MRLALALTMAGMVLTLPACQDQSLDGPIDIAKEVGPVIDLSVEDLVALQAEGNIRLIDVRTDEEVAGGIIPGAEHIVLDDLVPAALDLSDGRKVVFYCRSGRRSANAATRLSTHLGEPVRHLEDGIQGWERSGRRTVTE